MTDNTQPEAREFTMSQYASKDDMIGAMRKRIAELESELEAVGAGGVQALSAAPVAFLKSVIALCSHRGYSPANIEVWDKDDKWIADLWRQAESMLTTSPTPTPTAEQQAAPKAAPGVGNSGFDHQTAADLLSGKTVSDEAVRKFVAASRWAHDERAALSATLLAMHGVLTSREAEIALLKQALLEAETATQPAPAPLSEMPYEKRKAIQEGEQISASDAWFKARHEMLDTVDRRNVFRAGFDRGWNAAIAAQGGK